jgi:hypothetical protein
VPESGGPLHYTIAFDPEQRNWTAVLEALVVSSRADRPHAARPGANGDPLPARTIDHHARDD